MTRRSDCVSAKHTMKNTLAKVVQFHQQLFGMQGFLHPQLMKQAVVY